MVSLARLYEKYGRARGNKVYPIGVQATPYVGASCGRLWGVLPPGEHQSGREFEMQGMYWTMETREDATSEWLPQFGAWDRTDVMAERQDYRDGGIKASNIRVTGTYRDESTEVNEQELRYATTTGDTVSLATIIRVSHKLQCTRGDHYTKLYAEASYDGQFDDGHLFPFAFCMDCGDWHANDDECSMTFVTD